jgi:hypothetical protein
MEQVRAEQRFLAFFKKHAGVPAMRQMGRPAIAEAELACRKRFAVGKRVGFASNKVIHADQRTHLAANHVRLLRHISMS